MSTTTTVSVGSTLTAADFGNSSAVLLVNGSNNFNITVPCVPFSRPIQNIGSGQATIFPSGGTINGKASIVLWPSFGGTLMCDGLNVYFIGSPGPYFSYP